MNECKNCKQATKNPMYCSRSCAAIKTNKENPKRRKSNYCKKCNKAILSGRSHCKECFIKKVCIENKTLGELKKGGNANKYGYPMIRQDSRRKYLKSGRKVECKVCGYNLHVDICHIKDINKFDENTLIKEINDLNNLISLCKNHHWEFDNRISRNIEVPRYIHLTIEAGILKVRKFWITSCFFSVKIYKKLGLNNLILIFNYIKETIIPISAFYNISRLFICFKQK